MNYILHYQEVHRRCVGCNHTFLIYIYGDMTQNAYSTAVEMSIMNNHIRDCRGPVDTSYRVAQPLQD